MYEYVWISTSNSKNVFGCTLLCQGECAPATHRLGAVLLVYKSNDLLKEKVK